MRKLDRSPIISLLLAVSSLGAAPAPDANAWQSAAARAIQKLEGAELWVGGVVGVITPGQPADTRFYGETRPGSGMTVPSEAAFEIGSVSKSFTGILLAAVVTERPGLSVDDARVGA